MSLYFKKRVRRELQRAPTFFLFKVMFARLSFVLIIFFILKIIFDALVYQGFNTFSDYELQKFEKERKNAFINELREGTKTADEFDRNIYDDNDDDENEEDSQRDQLRKEYLRRKMEGDY